MLLTCPVVSNSLPKLVDEDPNEADVDSCDFVDETFGDRVRCTRDGVEKRGNLTNLLLDPSRAQLLCTIGCDDHKVIQNTRELSKFENDEDDSITLQTTYAYIKQCSQMDPEN